MAGKPGRRIPSNKKKQGGGRGSVGPGEHPVSNVSHPADATAAAGVELGSSTTAGEHEPLPASGATTTAMPNPTVTGTATDTATATEGGPLVPRPPFHLPRGRLSQRAQSEGSRGPPPTMMGPLPVQGYPTMSTSTTPLFGPGRGVEQRMHMPPPFVPTGRDPHPHHPHQQHHPQHQHQHPYQQQHQHHQQHLQGSIPHGMAGAPPLVGGPGGGFHQPMTYYPQPYMNYPTTTATTTTITPSLPPPLAGSSSTTTSRGYNWGTAPNTGGISGGGTGETIGTMGTPPPSISVASAAMAAATQGMKQLVLQDIERGLQIDFYSEGDLMILASWASFFRDQFIETRNELVNARNDRTAEAYRRATGFVERVEMKVLDTHAMKQIFRRLPITPVDDPPFVDTCYRAIIDFHMRNPPFDGFTFGNPTWRDYMWFKAGLLRVVDEGRNRFLDWYSHQIRNVLDVFIQSSSSGVEEELLKASTSGMQSKAAYARVKQVYIKVIGDVLPAMEDSGAATPLSIIGTKVRGVFSLDEEAFILAVIQTHLQAKQEQQKVSLPQDGPTSSLYKVIRTAMDLRQQLQALESSHGPDDPIWLFKPR